jgi:hypothetical protein
LGEEGGKYPKDREGLGGTGAQWRNLTQKAYPRGPLCRRETPKSGRYSSGRNIKAPKLKGTGEVRDRTSVCGDRGPAPDVAEAILLRGEELTAGVRRRGRGCGPRGYDRRAASRPPARTL